MTSSSIFSFSTSWNAFRHNSAKSLITEIKKLGFDKIELSFSLPKKLVDEIKEAVDNKEIVVTSVHNFTPLPKDLEGQRIYPDHYNIASLDDAIREKGVSLVKATIDTACSLGARVVVLHLGRVEMVDYTRDLAFLAGDEKNYQKMKFFMEKERAEKSKLFLSEAIKSLEEISLYALKKNIKIGLENRVYHFEIPSIKEMEVIFNRFKQSDNIYFWYDVGHAKVFENIGLVKPWEYLERFNDRLIGMHIHDVDFIDDHRAPGDGSVDFSGLLKCQGEEIPRRIVRLIFS